MIGEGEVHVVVEIEKDLCEHRKAKLLKGLDGACT